MTVQRSLAKWMQDNGFGTYNSNLFIGSVPQNAPIASWWIIGGGGSPTVKNETGEKMKAYLFNILYRSTDSEDVDLKLQSLEEKANSKDCLSIEDYETIEMEASGFQSDGDIDAEDRTIGSVEMTIIVYQSA